MTPAETTKRFPLRKGLIQFHLWLSVAGFLLLLFFAVTGFMLNHKELFGLDETETQTREITLPEALRADPKQDAVVAFLRTSGSVKGTLEDYEKSGTEIFIALRRPGERTDVEIDLEQGRGKIETERGSWLAALSEVHRSESTGSGAPLILDLVALLLILISLTGLTSALMLPARRRTALAGMAVSLAALTLFLLVSLN